MKHHSNIRKFGRKRNVRKGFMRSLAIALIREKKITTTEARAKSLRPYIERLLTHARKQDVAARRHVLARLGNNVEATKMLVDDIAPKHMERAGGYTRIVKLPKRTSDAAPMAIIEFVE